jgi:hypothetical protein
MPQELDLRAHMLRDQLSKITIAPEDKSLHQLKEEAIIRHFEEVAEISRLTALQEEIYAVGQNPDQAIRALAYAKKWGEVTQIADLEGGDPKYTWGRRFCAGGVSMKAAGWSVPGGVVMTWWK